MEMIFGVLCGIFVGIASAGYMFIQPIADRDKTISNQKAMIKNRDEKIDELVKQRKIGVKGNYVYLIISENSSDLEALVK